MTVGNFFSEIRRRFSLIQTLDILPFCGLIIISLISVIPGGLFIIPSAIMFGLKFTYRYVSSLVLLGLMWVSVKSGSESIELYNSLHEDDPTFEIPYWATIFGSTLAFCILALIIFLQYKAFKICKRNSELNIQMKNQPKKD